MVWVFLLKIQDIGGGIRKKKQVEREETKITNKLLRVHVFCCETTKVILKKIFIKSLYGLASMTLLFLLKKGYVFL